MGKYSSSMPEALGSILSTTKEKRGFRWDPSGAATSVFSAYSIPVLSLADGFSLCNLQQRQAGFTQETLGFEALARISCPVYPLSSFSRLVFPRFLSAQVHWPQALASTEGNPGPKVQQAAVAPAMDPSELQILPWVQSAHNNGFPEIFRSSKGK